MANGANISFFFSPGSVAVVGASDEPGKISNIIISSLLRSGFAGRIYPVNPKHSSVHGMKCLPALEDADEVIDVAVFAIPAGAVPAALRGAEGKIRGAIIVSGGFSETGEDGKALEREVSEAARALRIRVIGPNCMGIFDTVSRVDTFFIPEDRVKRPPPGGLSILSQSGSFAATAMDELAADGIGVARVVSYGNKSDVNESDCLDFLAGDPATKAVAVYVESIDDGRRFVEAASRCSSIKPVMAVKVGKAGAGATAARSHTGAIAGRYEIYRAAFRKAGVIELNGYEEFLAACKAFGLQGRAKGNRVIIITDGGGVGVGIADACQAIGLDAAPLPEELRAELKAVFPPYFSISNPLDLTGSATDESYALALSRTMAGEHYDIAIVAALWGPPALTEALPGMLAQKPGFTEKPIIVCSPGGEYARKRFSLFREAGLPVFSTPEEAVRAAAVLARDGGRGRG
ncbi:MAG TPA: CoA-binding protein [Deltaproteobacteria bacterium]|nr:MAG: acetate--CoA ligase [Deltaproteobacteria bacterium GWA2_55_82]OGQ64304.1 MAG: acetate--CoA ligase [Deltaproteobacteria bacterium RIFCSPLOWO2_02_FULL_55_12]OIJ74351.1 MAG: acetate--CoA ligase [Deltaproteobacteria bacterium GWC2_55_46]HBG46993.1 CoA-binding protein [Deltaproteobacteria bacterium]HCY10947.1 CoA-binding protein [Deltaproteobacteria bacterium]